MTGCSRAACRAALFLALALSASGCRQPELTPPSASASRQSASVALVLGSGGPRGFAHIGVLKALEEAGIRPDLIVGSSVGAVVGTLYASGKDAAALERIATDLKLLRVFELRQLVGMRGTGRPIEDFVNEEVGQRPLEALGTRVAVAATRMRDKALVLFDHGDAGRAVRASSADPDGFEPVEIAGERYADGDLASPVPIAAARRLGARFVIAVDVSAHASTTPPDAPRDWIEKDARRARQVAAEAPQADVLLHPDLGYYAGHSDAYRERVIAVAEQYTRERLPRILEAMKRAAPAPSVGR